MGKNKLKAGDGEGFLRAFTDAWSDVQIEGGVALSLKLFPSTRKGVLSIVLEASYVDEGLVTRTAGRYAIEYPTAQVGTLEAVLYQAVVRLERVLYDAGRYPSGRG